MMNGIRIWCIVTTCEISFLGLLVVAHSAQPTANLITLLVLALLAIVSIVSTVDHER